MKKYSLMIILAALVGMTSCTEGNVGSSISAIDVEILKDSSFVVMAESAPVEKIQSRTTSQLLGKIKAQNYGELYSDFVTQLMPSNAIDTAGVNVDLIDSAKFIMRIPMGGYFGDSIMPMRVDVHKLTKKLPSPIYSNFDASQYMGELMGSASYSASMLGQPDSVKPSNYREVAVPLPQSFAKELFTLYKNNETIFSSPSAFAEYFPGVYVKSSFGNGRVLNVDQTVVEVYYRKKVKEEEKDTIYETYLTYLATTPEVVTNSNIRLSVADEIKSRVAQGEVILQAPAGYDVKLTLPIKEMIDKIMNFIQGNSIGVLNALDLEIPVIPVENDHKILPPSKLLLIRESEKYEFFEKKKLPDNEKSFLGTYDSSEKKYVFDELRDYLYMIINDQDYEVKDGDDSFVIVPVTVESETDSYYGTTTIKRVTPYVAAPAIVQLDIDKLKLRMTLSRQTVLE